jgi:hypothetical protein
MSSHTPSKDDKADSIERDYESVGADIVVSHARDQMQTGVSVLRRYLKTAFSSVPAAERPNGDDKSDY